MLNRTGIFYRYYDVLRMREQYKIMIKNDYRASKEDEFAMPMALLLRFVAGICYHRPLANSLRPTR